MKTIKKPEITTSQLPPKIIQNGEAVQRRQERQRRLWRMVVLKKCMWQNCAWECRMSKGARKLCVKELCVKSGSWTWQNCVWHGRGPSCVWETPASISNNGKTRVWIQTRAEPRAYRPSPTCYGLGRGPYPPDRSAKPKGLQATHRALFEALPTIPVLQTGWLLPLYCANPPGQLCFAELTQTLAHDQNR